MAPVNNGRIYFLGFIFLIGVCVSRAKDGYLLTAPRVLRHGTPFQYCLTLYGESGSEKQAVLNFVNPISGKIVAKDDNLFVVGQQTCRDFTPPAKGDYELLLSNDTDILHDAVKVTVLPSNSLTLVQTDKPMYKPGQTVKFRIMTLLSDMRARTGQIKSIYISDPDKFRVKQYRDVETQGIASLEFQLGSEAKLGQWTIEVNVDEADEMKKEKKSTAQFTVKEYVLPRFEVEIEPPPFILATDETISGKVCAKYTYGKEVSGYLHLGVCWKWWYSPAAGPCYTQVVKIDGCYNFTVNTRDIVDNNYYSSVLLITAKITEDGTGATVSKNHTGPEKTSYPLKVKLDDYTNSFFKPGLPYYGKVSVNQPDGQPAAGEVIQVEAVDHEKSLHFARNFTTDLDGQFVFALCEGFTADTTNIFISATAVRFEDTDDLSRPPGYGPIPRPRPENNLYQPRDSRQVRQWFSPSLSYIQLPKPDGPHTCGQRLTLNVPYTTRENAQTSFQYQVMARGRVVKTGVVEYQQGNSPRQGMLYLPEQLCLQKDINWPEPPPSTEQEDSTSATPVQEIQPGPIPIIEHDSIREPVVRSEVVSDTVDSFLLDIPIESAMSPKFTLLVYHVMQDGEIVADSMEFDVEPCFENQVTLEFNETQALPGQNVDLQLGAAPGSVCGVGVIDKSVNILGGEHQVTPAKVFEKIEELSNIPYGLNSATYGDEYDYCEERIKNLQVDKSEADDSYWHYSSPYVDAIEAFKLSNMMVLTNLDLETRPCKQSVPVVYAIAPVARGGGPPESGKVTKPSVRSNFPETWLWTLAVADPDGKAVMPETAPDTITSWVANALCISGDQGFGLSEVTSLTTFQPFFLSIHLPYAAVMSERFPIMITVYNYLEKCITVNLDLNLGSNFEVHNSGQYAEPICICGGKSDTAKFYVTAQNFGSLPVIAKATIVAGQCRESVDIDLDYVGLSDEVHRKVLVKPPGVEQEYSYSTYLCSKDGSPQTEDVALELPPETDMVQGSARGEVQVIGDIMGPAFSNLDNLVRMPTGCGEQNMVGFVPNILVLNYLSSTGTLEENIKMEAIKNMEAGYQRELNYRHKDGSFSAFGEKGDKSAGSVWLTAFVVKSFAQASKHIFIDAKDLAKSVKFLERSQLENGCFRETGKVLSTYMMGGLGRIRRNVEDDPPLAALTAYVLVALMEAGVNTSSPTIQSGIECMNAEFRLRPGRTDPYTVALITYANVQFDPRSQDSRLAFRTLRWKAKKDRNTMYWSRGRYQPPATSSWYYRAAPSAEVEMTSYALMSYMKVYRRRPVQMSSNIAVWLTRQRNANGGFASTQDTVVGLDALSQFATLAFSKNPTELTVQVSSSSGPFEIDQEFKVSDSEGDTRFLLQSEPFKFSSEDGLSSTLKISTSGVGCALVQTNVRYNKPEEASLNGERGRLFLEVQVRRDLDKCNRRTLHLNVWSRKGHMFHKGMGMVTVRMITSWSLTQDSINNLKSLSPILGVKRVEYNEEEGVLALYFDKFTRKPKKFTIDVEQDRELAVSSTSPAEVKVFEYYEKDVANVQEYNIRTTCGTKEEIPLRIVPGPPNVGFGRIEQRRVFSPPRGCPRCITTAQTIPPNFQADVCKAVAVYKTVAGRKGVKSMKINQDLRPVTKLTALNQFASPDMAPRCNCSLLSIEGKPRRVMIIASRKVFQKQLYLDQDSIVMRTSVRAENAARAAQATCPIGE